MKAPTSWIFQTRPQLQHAVPSHSSVDAFPLESAVSSLDASSWGQLPEAGWIQQGLLLAAKLGENICYHLGSVTPIAFSPKSSRT